MQRDNTNQEFSLFNLWLNRFKAKKLKLEVGSVGIYRYIFIMDTINEQSHSHRYNIYAKIKALAIYESVIEAELVDLHINEPMTDDVLTIIKKNFPKYVDPVLVRWEIKNK